MGIINQITTCPHCGYKADCASGFEPGSKPHPGSVSLCMACGGLAQFGPDMQLVLMSDTETKEAEADPHIAMAQMYIRGGHKYGSA